MPQANQMGVNRTGMDMSPIQGEAMKQSREFTIVGPIRYEGLDNIRRSYATAEAKVGSVPIPASPKGLLSSGKEKFKGHNPEVLINKLGQRLSFERTGVRLYEALILKCESSPDQVAAKTLPLDELKRFREQEAEHLLLVKQVMEDLGADPTAVTPDADTAALASLGITKVLTEPRTSISQCLEAMLTVELTDHAAWNLLQELCTRMGMDEIAEKFGYAHEQEEIHGEKITKWLREVTLIQGGIEDTAHH